MGKMRLSYYDSIAPYWDIMYSSEPFYRKGFAFIDSYRQKNNLPKKILDVACGTGQLLAIFEIEGYDAYGSDISPAFLRIARKKLKHAHLKRKPYQEISFPTTFPIIISFFNSFAYCQDSKTFIRTLKNLRNLLTENGILIFDLVLTDQMKEDVFGTKEYFSGNVSISRSMHAHAKDRKWYTKMVYFILENRKSKIIAEKTVRGIFSRAEMVDIIKKSGYKIDYIGKGYFDTTFVIRKLENRKTKSNN
ncbi:MAG: class I SAM-dependent methyltransferase [Candidatus Diapherotrites archaeon]|nr:class I SAM-dependent methyltransferase [Candidatus Diapherotrites archaeon]